MFNESLDCLNPEIKYFRMPFGELKDLCKENSLSKKGTKKDLILRLIQHKCLPESIDSTESTTENNNNMCIIDLYYESFIAIFIKFK